MSDLVQRLAAGDSKITYRARRDAAKDELKDAIDRQYVHVLFTETRGGTELGFPLDKNCSDVSRADWESGAGSVHLEGDLKLDGVPVRCVADLDLSTVEGLGRLVIREERPAAS
jgi:hypothetical protein